MRDREYSAFMLLSAPGFGAKSIHYVYNRLSRIGLKVSDLFDQNLSRLSTLLPDIGHGKFSRADLASLHSIDEGNLYMVYQKLKNEKVYIIGLDDERYPKVLIDRLGESAPPVLFCKGCLPLLHAESISIVGSRDVSDQGVALTKRIATRLAANGYNVTSGFAKGVDTSAHIGALESNGTTTMVLSYGFNHLSVKKDIKEYDLERNALFVSQFMPHERFSGQNAMARNKVVCALSKAVIVISSGPERDSSGKMSGTFDAGLTSRKYNIPLFVLYPLLLTPPPQGNIDLIKLGGISLSNGNQLVQHLNSLVGHAEVIKNQSSAKENRNDVSLVQNVEEPETEYQVKTALKDDMRDKILNVLNGRPISLTEIIKLVHLDWTTKKLAAYLKKMTEVEIIKKGQKNYYKNRALQIRQGRLANDDPKSVQIEIF